MSVSWVQSDPDEPFAQRKLSRLIKSIVDPEDPIPAIHEIANLGDLLILSNHLDKANELLSAAYSFAAHAGGSPLTPRLGQQVFWETHKEFKYPENLPSYSLDKLESTRWGKYRECTRTGWMLEHWGVAEPPNPSEIWRETNDPVMLAMCARLLAKTMVPETYPPPETMREALAVAQKFYALPELPISEWMSQLKSAPARPPSKTYDPARPPRHSDLLYRRLVIELALRLNEFQTAADLLGQALRMDGLTYDGSLGHYLILPGIYDALTLLAEGGKERNPFFIPHDDAEVIVSEVKQALELRATKGRQWELAEDKVGWIELLDRLAAGAWKVYRKEYRSMGVMSADEILFDPATEKAISKAEKKVGELPSDLKAMARVANGFKGGFHFFGGGIAGTQFIKMVDDDDELENNAGEFQKQGLRQDGNISGRMIELEPGADETDGFHHYIIPPAMWKANVVGREVKEGEYQYWHTAAWRVGISRWNSIRDYVASCVEEVEGMAERGEVGYYDGESVDSEDLSEEDSDDDSEHD